MIIRNDKDDVEKWAYSYKRRPVIKKEEQSNVNHPKHYNQCGIECIDAIKGATCTKVGVNAFYVGNIIKYLWRCEEKNGLEDLKKAKWYLERLIKEKSENND